MSTILNKIYRVLAAIVVAIGVVVLFMGSFILIDYAVKSMEHFYLAFLGAFAAFAAGSVPYRIGFRCGFAQGREAVAKGLAETLSVEGPESVLKTVRIWTRGVVFADDNYTDDDIYA